MKTKTIQDYKKPGYIQGLEDFDIVRKLKNNNGWKVSYANPADSKTLFGLVRKREDGFYLEIPCLFSEINVALKEDDNTTNLFLVVRKVGDTNELVDLSACKNGAINYISFRGKEDKKHQIISSVHHISGTTDFVIVNRQFILEIGTGRYFQLIAGIYHPSRIAYYKEVHKHRFLVFIDREHNGSMVLNDEGEILTRVV